MPTSFHPSLTLLAASTLIGCATPPAPAWRVAVDTEEYNRGSRVETPALPRRALFPSTYRPIDKFVRTVSFRDSSGEGYFEIAFQRLPGKEGVGDVASVVATKAYCASAPQVTLGISLQATPTPYCAQRADPPIKVSSPREIRLAAGARHTIDLGGGDRVSLRLVEATATP